LIKTEYGTIKIKTKEKYDTNDSKTNKAMNKTIEELEVLHHQNSIVIQL